MKKLFILGITASLLVIPLAMNAASGQTATEPPPIAQALVREGDLAIKLVDRLKIGTAENEAEAESMLASTGIAPRNGWIADYPVTPDIIGELQDAVGEAVDSQRLAMGKDEALRQFQDLTAGMGFSVVADTRGEVAQDEPSRDYGEYSSPEVINNYYYNEGPPVVTYYPPPWDYYYMYAWVPYPFWCSGSFFPGFFILHDFHRTFFVDRRVCVVSNHFRDPRTHRVSTIDPVTRHTGRTFRGDFDPSRRRGFPSTEAKKGAASIFERGRERRGFPNVQRGTNSMLSRPGGQFEFRGPDNRGNRRSAPNVRGSGPQRPSTTDRWMGRSRGEVGSRGPGERTFSRQRGTESRAIPNFNRSTERIDRSSRAPSTDNGRSSNAPLRGESRSFSIPSMGMGSRDSFVAPQGGGRSGGLGGGSFLGGR
jgi:hypothetical protein